LYYLYFDIMKRKEIKMQTIQFKVDSKYIDIVINLLNSLNGLKLNVIKDLSIKNSSDESTNEEWKDSKKIDFSDFSGIWENREISQESLREEAWK